MVQLVGAGVVSLALRWVPSWPLVREMSISAGGKAPGVQGVCPHGGAEKA